MIVEDQQKEKIAGLVTTLAAKMDGDTAKAQKLVDGLIASMGKKYNMDQIIASLQTQFAKVPAKTASAAPGSPLTTVHTDTSP